MKLQITEGQKFQKSQDSIKSPKRFKGKLEALIKLTHTKCAHEMINVRIEIDTENGLTLKKKIQIANGIIKQNILRVVV